MNRNMKPCVSTKKTNAGALGLFAVLLVVGLSGPVQASPVDDAVGLAVETVQEMAPGVNGCSKTEGGGGAGDNSAKCEMTCDIDRYLSISVDSSDDEGRWPASVSGSIACGGGEASCSDDEGHCTGGGTGNNRAKTTTEGKGTCKGKSDEYVESQLTVSCSADKASFEPPNDDWCPLYRPIEVCLDLLPDGVEDIIIMLIGPGGLLGGTWEQVQDLLDPYRHNETIEELTNLVGPIDHREITGKVLETVPLRQLRDEVLDDTLIQYAGPNPLEESKVTSTWSQATAVDPLLPWKAVSHDSLVWMHYDGTTAIGINCHKGACHEFIPLLVNDEGGLLLSTP